MRICHEKKPGERQVEDIVKDIITDMIKRPLHFIMHLLACAYIFLFFFVLFMVFIRGPTLFFFQYFGSAKGNIIEIKSVHGGDDLYFDNGSIFHWIIAPHAPKIGDYFDKEKYSFRYLVNGKNATTRSEAMVLTSVPIPPKYAFPLMILMIIFQFVYYKMYGKVVVFGKRTIDKDNPNIIIPDPLGRPASIATEAGINRHIDSNSSGSGHIYDTVFFNGNMGLNVVKIS
jgi:hypothetical protein